MRNIEIKARFPDLSRGRELAARLGATFRGVLLQTDTFYNTRSGRMKLRRLAGGTAELTLYHRPDTTAPRPSEYVVIPVAEPDRTAEMLEAALGVQIEVKKTRELWILDNVRLHLDQVEGLGSFLELEAVVDEAHPEETCFAAVRDLMTRLGIQQADLLSRPYADQLAAARPGRG